MECCESYGPDYSKLFAEDRRTLANASRSMPDIQEPTTGGTTKLPTVNRLRLLGTAKFGQTGPPSHTILIRSPL